MNEQTNHAHHDHHYKHPWPFLRDIEKIGDEYLVRKAPYQLPHKWKDVVVKLLPILTLIVAIIALPGLLGGLLAVVGIAGHSAMNRGIYHVYGGAPYLVVLIQFLITLTITVLYFKAFDPLRKRQYVGWAYVFYASLLGFVANLLDGGVIGALIMFIIGTYLLFQAKELYH